MFGKFVLLSVDLASYRAFLDFQNQKTSNILLHFPHAAPEDGSELPLDRPPDRSLS